MARPSRWIPEAGKTPDHALSDLLEPTALTGVAVTGGVQFLQQRQDLVAGGDRRGAGGQGIQDFKIIPWPFGAHPGLGRGRPEPDRPAFGERLVHLILEAYGTDLLGSLFITAQCGLVAGDGYKAGLLPTCQGPWGSAAF